MGKVLCVICNKRCRGTVLKIEDHYLHKLCFKCHRCGKALDEKNFQFRDQCLYCPEDYRQEYSTKCAACGNPVEGEVVTALGSTFHTFCLRCFSCNRTISSGEKTVTLNNRFYCEKCVPPQIAQENSTGVEEVTPNPPENLISSSTPPPQDLLVEPREKSPPKVKIPKSSSLPRRLGDLFRSKKSRSQTLQSTAPSTLVEDSTLKNTTLTNGTDALTVNVGETDMASTDSGIGKKFDHSQSPTYSLYSGDETVLAKQQDVQTTPMEGYPVTYSTSGTPAVPYSLDAALTTPSIVNTLSGDASTLLFGSVRRICPPGVDYGHQYPVSYLRLAEQGYTAVTSSDLLSSTSPLSATTTPAFFRRPPPSASASSTQRLSRRDMPSTHHSQTRTLATSSADSTSRQGGGFMDHRYCAQVFGEVDGARPEKDRYTRYRQLSPTGSLMGRALSSGRSVGAPPNFIVRKSQTYSSYSTPNVNSRRGIRVLAESMMRSPPRVGRSVSPEAAILAQAEARRLAAYPGAKIPDADSEPAIDRYDWPAPPSPAVVMIDRRREKAMKSGTLPDGRTITKSEESSSDTRTLSPGTVHSLSPEKDAPPTSVESKINTLKRTTGNSGMSAAVAQYVEEEEKRQKTSLFDLDPISASRSPSANFEPPYSTRYANHRFASPSRSTLRREEMRDGLTGTRDHFSTSPIRAAQSSTTLVPQPGYTSGILSSRPVSLPRGVNGVTFTTFPPWSSAVSPAQRKIYASKMSRTLPANTTSGPLSDSRNGAFTLTTSGLSMNGMVGATDAQLAQPLTTLATNQDSCRARSTTLTGGLPPPSISGLRPVGPRGYNYLGGTSFEPSRGRPTKAAAINATNGWRTARTASENARFIARGGSDALLDDEYPDVQSWLRPTKSQQYQGQKIYSYDQLKVSSNANLKGIDERHREEYLSAEEFERLFKMPKTAFQRLPEWKKSDLKRRLDLY